MNTLKRGAAFQRGVKRLLCVTLVISLFCFSLPPFVAAAPDNWYNAAWSYRIPLTIDHTKVAGASLDSFPVLVSITLLNPGNPQADGDDFVFTASDGTTKLDHDIESWDALSGALVAWVRIPTLTNAADTSLFLYYGNGGASNQQAATSVWSNAYRLVQHMKQAGSYQDSSPSGNNGTGLGGPTALAGKIGSAAHFDGVDDVVVVPNSSSLNMTDVLTASLWIKNDSVPAQYDGVLGKPNDFWTDSFGFFYNSGTQLIFFVNDYTTGAVTAPINPTDWNYVVGVYDGTNATIFVNGVQVATRAVAGPVTANTKNLSIGRLSTNTYNVDGLFDEVHVANAARTADWIATEYENQTNPQTFVIAGAQQTDDSSWYLAVSGASGQVAGSTQTITFTLKDGGGNAVSTYTGDKSITLSGPNAAPNGTAGTCIDKNGAPIAVGMPTVVTFTNGVGSCVLSLYAAETVSMDVSDGSYSSSADAAYDLDITVAAGALATLGAVAPSEVTAGTGFELVVTSTDAYGNKQNTLAQAVSLSVTAGSVSPAQIAAADFVAAATVTTTVTITAVAPATQTTLTLQSGAVSKALLLNVVTVTPPPVTPSPVASGGGVNYFAPAPTNAFTTFLPAPSSTTSTVLHMDAVPKPVATTTATTATPAVPPDFFSETISPELATSGVSAPTETGTDASPARPVLDKGPSSLPAAPTNLPTSPSRVVEKNYAKTISESILGKSSTGAPAPFVPWDFLTAAQKKKLPPKTMLARLEDRREELSFTLASATNEYTPELVVNTEAEATFRVRVAEPVRAIKAYVIAGGDSSKTSSPLSVTFLDDDKDGVYEAKISTGNFPAESELLTVIDFVNPSRVSEILKVKVRQVAAQVLDENNVPVEGALVMLYTNTDQAQTERPWDAEAVGQRNPMLTRSAGRYYMSPPAGTYTLVVSKDGFTTYRQAHITIKSGEAISVPIVLHKKISFIVAWWQTFLSWFRA